MNMKYLADLENNLIVNKPLCRALSVGPAICLGKLAHWLRHNERYASRQNDNHFRDGRWWSWNTYAEWEADIEIYSKSSIIRYFNDLEGLGVVLSSTEYNQKGYDQTKWYSIDESAYSAFIDLWEESGSPKRSPRNTKRFWLLGRSAEGN